MELRHQLEERVEGLLRTPEQFEPALGIVQPRLRTWAFPAFHSPRAWILWKEYRHRFEFLRVRRVVWDRTAELEDLAKALEVAPEARLPDRPARIHVTDGDVDVERWQAFEDAAANVVIPPVLFPGRVLSLDGVELGIEQSFAYHSLRLVWKLGLPREWKPLTRWTQQVHDFFDESLAPAP